MCRTTKDFLTGSKKVLKNVTSEISNICVENDIEIDCEVISLAVGLLCLDPQNEFSLDLEFQSNREAVDKFVKKCVRMFSENPLLCRTLELQVLFMRKCSDLKNFQNAYEEKITTKCEILTHDILDFEVKGKDDHDKLFRKIVIDMIVSNKLGKPTKDQVITETTNALKSVFARADLVEFAESKRRRRLDTLKNLRQLVCGIRLFNKDAGHCGEGVRDIVSDLNLAFENTEKELINSLSFTDSFIQYFLTVSQGLVANSVDSSIAKLIEQVKLETFRDGFILAEQHHYYMKFLIEMVKKYKKSADIQTDKFRETLGVLHEVVKYRIAVATEKVFPHFITLSTIWRSFLAYLNVLVEINILNDLMSRITEYLLEGCDWLYSLSKKFRDIKRLFPQSINVTHPECEVICPITNIKVKPFSQFCAYTLVQTNGILLPAKPHLGVLHYKTFYFGFSESTYMNKFSEDIEKNHVKFLMIVRRNPHLIVFFDLFDAVQNLKIQEQISIEEEKIEKNDVEIQTDLHPIPFHKDKNYTWNIWDLRRKAIQLANIKKCKTHSVQTDISYFRQANRLQTYQLREKSHQTMRTLSVSTSTGVQQENFKLSKLLAFDDEKCSTVIKSEELLKNDGEGGGEIEGKDLLNDLLKYSDACCFTDNLE